MSSPGTKAMTSRMQIRTQTLCGLEIVTVQAVKSHQQHSFLSVISNWARQSTGELYVRFDIAYSMCTFFKRNQTEINSTDDSLPPKGTYLSLGNLNQYRVLHLNIPIVILSYTKVL